MRHIIYFITVVILGLISLFAFGTSRTEAEATLSFSPGKVIQGKPVQITLKGTRKSDKITVTFAGKIVPMSKYGKVLLGFVPIDINKSVGNYEVKTVIERKNGNGDVIEHALKKDIEVITRVKYEAELGIPQKLGGNTKASQKELVNTLAEENKSLLNLKTAEKALWKNAFIYPVKNPIVTDPYGYSRLTGAYTITHKGTDFRAPVGTEVYAVNDGEVRLAQLGRNYGNTLVIDHGNGVQSFYMHLSEMKVRVGDTVTRGELVGLSGMTGYAEAAHLHFTLRINDTSIDPMVFLGFFK